MLYLDSDLQRQALDSLQRLLEGRIKTAITSFAAFNMVFSQLAALSLKASALVSHQLPLVAPLPEVENFSWTSTPAYTSFQWHDCFNGFKCARLQVPMDWHHNTTEKDKTVELAVIKLEATVPITDPSYGGLVFFNPGGPGGSGVKQILDGGNAFQTILSAGTNADTVTARNFDVISFDPRGVNNTRPMLTCHPNHLEAAKWTIEQHAEGYIGDTPASFNNLWARLRAIAEGCSERTAKEGIAKHMSTAPVARDVVEIFEKHGEWREKEAQRLLKTNTGLYQDERQAVLHRTLYRKEQEKIQYWGFSYGSILGAHIAAMYPDRIGRLVIDGVANSHDYMAGGWLTNLQDTDMAFTKLAEYCWAGGAQDCPLWHKDGPAYIVDSIVATLEDFQQNPIGIPGTASSAPAMVNYRDYETLIRDDIYNLMVGLPRIAQVIYELGQRNGTSLLAFKRSQMPDISEPLTEACLKNGPYSEACQSSAGSMDWAATYAIACSDGLPRTKQSKEDYKRYANVLIEQSSMIGASWAEIQLPCTAWNARPAWRYDGDFYAETAHPIMLIGNTYDPVTPLRNAFHMAKGYKDAVVLHQNSEGHSSYASPSMCTGKAVRKYFQTGDLPESASAENAAFCEPDMLPLHGYQKGSKPAPPEGETDTNLWDALVRLNQAFL